MAHDWESQGVKAAGQKYAEAQKRGDKAGMAAASAEANRLRGESGYSLDGGSTTSRPNVTNDAAWQNGPIQNYMSGNGLGGSPSANRTPTYDPVGYAEKAYRDLLKKQEEANRLAVQQGVNRLEGNRGTINQGYDEAARQAYIYQMQRQKGLGQQLAGQGITGGATESARLALDTSYGNNINANEQSRRNALTGLDQSIADLRNTGDLNLVEQQLALQQQMIADRQNAYQQQLAQDNFLKQFEYQGEQDKLAAAAQAEETAYDRWYREQQLANDTRQTNYNVSKPHYKPTVPKQEEYKPRLTGPQAMAAHREDGVETDEVLMAMDYWYGTNLYGKRKEENEALATETIQRWWSSMPNKTSFSQQISNAIAQGTITPEDYNAWRNQVGR